MKALFNPRVILVLVALAAVAPEAHAFFFRRLFGARPCTSCIRPAARVCLTCSSSFQPLRHSFCGSGSCVGRHFSGYHRGFYPYYGYGLTLLEINRLKFYPAGGRYFRRKPYRLKSHLVRVFKENGKWYEELSNGAVNWLAADDWNGEHWRFASDWAKQQFCGDSWDWYKDWRRGSARKPPKKLRAFLDSEWAWCGFSNGPDWRDPIAHAEVASSCATCGTRGFSSSCASCGTRSFVSTGCATCGTSTGIIEGIHDAGEPRPAPAAP